MIRRVVVVVDLVDADTTVIVVGIVGNGDVTLFGICCCYHFSQLRCWCIVPFTPVVFVILVLLLLIVGIVRYCCCDTITFILLLLLLYSVH
jgi:hypothetical protein